MKSKGLTSRQMSHLYKQARKQGQSPQQAYMITGKAKVLSKKTIPGSQKYIKRKYPYLDFDGDNKVNKYDCQPLNKYKQDKEIPLIEPDENTLYYFITPKTKAGKKAWKKKFGDDLYDPWSGSEDPLNTD